MNTAMIIGFLFFTIMVALVSWYTSKQNKVNTVGGLFLANRSLGFLMVGAGLLFTNINTASIIGENELAYTKNMTVLAWGTTSVLAMLIVSEFLMPLYVNLG